MPVLNKHLPAHGIDTPLRLAHLAQVGHETMSFYYYREIASGEAYEGRKDLGNIRKGDGVKFKGRGAIQVTGRNNYSEASQFCLAMTDYYIRLNYWNCLNMAFWPLVGFGRNTS